MENNSRLKIMIPIVLILLCFVGCSTPIKLTSESVQVAKGQKFEPTDYLVDDQKNIGDIEIESNVNVNEIGNYLVIYKHGSESKSLNVAVLSDTIILSKEAVEVDLGSTFDPYAYIVNRETSLDIKADGNVDTSKPGQYTIVYRNSTVEKILQVTVKMVSENDDTDSAKPIDKNQTISEQGNGGGYNLKLVLITSPVQPGGYAVVEVKGMIGKEYTLSVTYDLSLDDTDGLGIKTAGKDGKVSWEWKVKTDAPLGKWKVLISGDGKSITTYLDIN